MFGGLRQILIGAPIPTEREVHERLSKVRGLAVFSSDALSSVAYATEEILRALVLAGAAALTLALPIGTAITAVLVIVAFSYFQTIHAYPAGGGAYIVAHDNLGLWPGLVAAAALLIDYTLTVAVSITAGVAAITSAFPALLPWRIAICLVAIVVLLWGNLRGVRESGLIFSIPTYAFIFVFLALIGTGLWRLSGGALAPAPTTAGGDGIMAAVTVAIIFRAFASGCAALTGIEAISNGVMSFRPPEATNAGRTLAAMAVLLATMFMGITILAYFLHVVPTDHETVVSQVGRAVFRGGPWYFALQIATALILFLAGNTAFAGFPSLASIMARDGFLPRQFANRGDRLVYTTGILALAATAMALVIIFAGSTHALIPLYAVGVFMAFTLSQAGMVRRWLAKRGPGWHWKAAVNGLGMTATAIVVVIIVLAKFLHGAWIVIVLIPVAVLSFRVINRHYATVRHLLSLEDVVPKPWTNLATHERQKVVIPVSGMHKGTLKALRFAREMTSDVTAVMVELEPGSTEPLQRELTRWAPDVKHKVIPSEYRSIVVPLLEYLEDADRRDSQRGLAVVVIPEFVPARAWQKLLHNQTANLIKKAILYQRGLGQKDRIVISVPFHLTR